MSSKENDTFFEVQKENEEEKETEKKKYKIYEQTEKYAGVGEDIIVDDCMI